MWFFNEKSLISKTYWSLEETVMDTENILWKFELDQIIFLDNFTVIWCLEYKEIRVSGAKLFFRITYAF